MLVITKYNLAYKNVAYPGGVTIEMDERDYSSYKNDVIRYDSIKFNLENPKPKKVIAKKPVKRKAK